MRIIGRQGRIEEQNFDLTSRIAKVARLIEKGEIDRAFEIASDTPLWSIISQYNDSERDNFLFHGEGRVAVSYPSISVERLVSAIYLAEGGERAKKPFGILSVPCSDFSSCQKICRNTVVNNLKRWEAKTHGAEKFDTFLEFLASRYAPIGVSNDPRNLNVNWLKNVKHFYNEQRVRAVASKPQEERTMRGPSVSEVLK